MVWVKLKNPELSISNSAGFTISGDTVVEAPSNLKISPDLFYIYNSYEEAIGSALESDKTKVADTVKAVPTINRKYADNLLSQNTRTILKSLKKDKPNAEDAKILLDAERKGKKRSVVINFLKTFV